MRSRLLALRELAMAAAKEIDSLHVELAVFNQEAWLNLSPEDRRGELVALRDSIYKRFAALLRFAPHYEEVEAELSPCLTAAAMRLARSENRPLDISCCIAGTEETAAHWTQIIARISSNLALSLRFLEDEQLETFTVAKSYTIFRTGLAKTPGDTWPDRAIIQTRLEHEFAEALSICQARGEASLPQGGDQKLDDDTPKTADFDGANVGRALTRILHDCHSLWQVRTGALYQHGLTGCTPIGKTERLRLLDRLQSAHRDFESGSHLIDRLDLAVESSDRWKLKLVSRVRRLVQLVEGFVDPRNDCWRPKQIAMGQFRPCTTNEDAEADTVLQLLKKVRESCDASCLLSELSSLRQAAPSSAVESPQTGDDGKASDEDKPCNWAIVTIKEIEKTLRISNKERLRRVKLPEDDPERIPVHPDDRKKKGTGKRRVLLTWWEVKSH